MPWRLKALTMGFGIGIWWTTSSISHRAGRSCWVIRNRRSANRPEEWLDRIHVADRERVKDEIAAHQRGLTPHFESENRVQHKDGSFRWMLSRGLAVRDASGKPSRMAGSQTDITGGKIADALTGLPNRLLFIDRLARLIEHYETPQGLFVCSHVLGPRRVQDDQRQSGSCDRRSTLGWSRKSAGKLLAG